MMIDNITKKHESIIVSWDLPKTFFDDITVYLQNLIAILNKKPNKKRSVLIALAEASSVCPPTWYEIARREVLSLLNIHSPEDQLLQWIQEMKEEIILNVVQNKIRSDWHGINFIRIAENFYDNEKINRHGVIMLLKILRYVKT
ncbi:MAG: DUF1539 domain-containing protein [Chlamydiales bacterium]